MVVVITRPDFWKGEAAAIIRLLERSDVDRLHIRKPEASEREVEDLLQRIPEQYYPRLSMHDFFSLAERYHLGGIHLTGRHPDAPADWQGLISTSCHSLEELALRKQEGVALQGKHRPFDYLSLSPIYDSISKQGYHAAFTPEQLQAASADGLIDQRVLALGGVSFDRIPEVKAMGFGGVMILGDAWKLPRVLTIAGSDSGGGAGVQADIKTISACRCYAASAITAITVQNTVGVSAVHPVPVDIIGQQIAAVIDDIGVDAIKIGMLHSAEVVKEVAARIAHYGIRNVVLDPVMVSTSGHRLIEESAISSLMTELMPLARVITPNIPEAELQLGGRMLDDSKLLPDAARELADRVGTSVLLKAGHLTDDRLVDILYDAETGTLHELPSVRVHTRNTHGTGCTLSSALASMLARGYALPEAAAKAKNYINEAIIAGADYVIGHGHGPVCHFHEFWK